MGPYDGGQKAFVTKFANFSIRFYSKTNTNNYSTMPNSYNLEYTECQNLLIERLQEAPPGRIQLLTGPRQVGKTTLLLELTQKLGKNVLYSAGDAPEAALPGAWERLWTQAEALAKKHGKAIVLLDEIQYFGHWSERLKGEWDRLKRHKIPVHIVATGSSALKLRAGSRESLAGRFERLTLAHWPAQTIATRFKLSFSKAAEYVALWGSYPGTWSLRQDMRRWKAYVQDAIIEPAIAKDILALAEVRRPALLRQIFSICASSPAQIISLQKLQGQLQDRGALETIVHYLHLLQEAYLVVPLEKHTSRPLRRRAAPPKLITLNNALLAAVDPRGHPNQSQEPDRFGAWVENACLAFAWNRGQHVSYWREEPLEVDGVIEGSWGSWVVEVTLGKVDSQAMRGLLEFNRQYPKYRPLIICEEKDLSAAARLGIPHMTWQKFLWQGPREE